MPATRVRLLSANFRLEPESAEDIEAGHTWAVRRPLVSGLLDYWSPSIICGQECSTQIRADLTADLSGWRMVRNGNVSVWWDTGQHTLISSGATMLPTPPRDDGLPIDPRRLVLARLQVKSTGDHLWVASTHFTAGDPVWQPQQMAAAVAYVTTNGNVRNTILAGDFNAGGTDTESPREIARDGGLFDLRSKLAAPRIRNVDWNTYNGWQPTKRDGWWIDDVLTGENLQPYYARVVDTSGASDHGWLLASSVQIADET